MAESGPSRGARRDPVSQISSGILAGGRLVAVPGLAVVPPSSQGGPSWCLLDPGDYRARSQARPQLVIDHTTGGKWPQRVLPGSGPGGHAEQIARMWSGGDGGAGKSFHSGAQILIDLNGEVYCLCDVVTCAAYHAEMANDVSIGVEHCTTPDGNIYQATLDASTALHAALESILDIPYQVHAAPYRGGPLVRCEVGEKTPDYDGRSQSRLRDMAGIIQHRDQTSERGRGDAGDALVAAHISAGAEPLDYGKYEDISAASARQRYLNERGGALAVDGICGPMSLAEARRQGFRRWRDVPGR
jgi:hypothetical protein